MEMTSPAGLTRAHAVVREPSRVETSAPDPTPAAVAGRESAAPDLAAHALAALPLFDRDWYAARYPDVVASGIVPAQHYFRYGALLRRQPGRYFDARRHAETHRLGDEDDPLAHFVATYGTAHGALVHPPASVTDLGAKLWGGFSALAAADLALLALDTSQTGRSRAAAAVLLARWHAGCGDPLTATRWMDLVRDGDPALFRTRRCRLLLIDCCARTGAHAEGLRLATPGPAEDRDGNFACARNNLIARAGGPDADRDRLGSINALFAAHGLSPIHLEDPAKGQAFGNWAADLPPARTVKGPRVSILVPVYDAGRHLDVAISSLLAQTWTDLEIVAVDDCSPDDSWIRLQRLAATDSRLRIFRNETNLGAYPTRNRALALATGEFVTVHDSDDWSHPQMIEMQMAALLADPSVRATCSSMARVLPDMRFLLRPQRENLEYVHRSFPSLLMRRADVLHLGQWDQVSANADSEFMSRVRQTWGPDAIADVLPDVPLSFFLVHDKSLTQQKATSLSSLTFGIRREYLRQAEHWRRKAAGGGPLHVARTGYKHPFPIPQGLGPKDWPRDWAYDVVLVSDLSLGGDTLADNRTCIETAAGMGLRVGMVHWPRYDLPFAAMDGAYLDLCYHDRIDLLVPEDTVTANLVLVHHPAILAHRIDAVPTITTPRVVIVADEPPTGRWSLRAHRYDPEAARQTCAALFRREPDWAAASARVRDVMRICGAALEDASPLIRWPARHPLPAEVPQPRSGFGGTGPIVAGRLGTDTAQGWPAHAATLAAAYCADADGIEVRVRGSAEAGRSIFGHLPHNWRLSDQDAEPQAAFLADVDFVILFPHEDMIDPLGRTAEAAMAAGRVVIVPNELADLCGAAAIACEAADVQQTLRRLWADPDAYRAQAARGFAHAAALNAPEAAQATLRRLLPAR